MKDKKIIPGVYLDGKDTPKGPPDIECMLKLELKSTMEFCYYKLSIIPNPALFVDIDDVIDRMTTAYVETPDENLAEKAVLAFQLMGLMAAAERAKNPSAPIITAVSTGGKPN